MPNRNYSDFPERKISNPAKGLDLSKKGHKGPRFSTEKTAAWPRPKPTWGTSFNRTVKATVTKTRAAKHGVD